MNSNRPPYGPGKTARAYNAAPNDERRRYHVQTTTEHEVIDARSALDAWRRWLCSRPDGHWTQGADLISGSPRDDAYIIRVKTEGIERTLKITRIDSEGAHG